MEIGREGGTWREILKELLRFLIDLVLEILWMVGRFDMVFLPINYLIDAE